MKPLLLLTLSLLPFAVRPAEDSPVDAWLERVEDLDTLAVEFELASSAGTVAHLRFAYEAPDRCHMRTLIDGETAMEVWFDGGVATFHAVQDDGETVVGSFDWEEIGAGPVAWLDALNAAVPSGEPGPSRGAGPIFDLWPNLESRKVDIAIKYQTSRRSLFDFLPRLKRDGHELVALEDGWSVALAEGARLELEPQLGIPRGFWLEEDGEEHRKLELLSLAIDGELDDAELTPSAAPAGSVSRSAEMARSYGRSLWGEFRRGGYQWLAERADDGADLEGELREVVVASFSEWHSSYSGEELAQMVEAESELFDRWLDKVVEWYDANREQPDASDKLSQALRGGREGVRGRLDKLREGYAERFGEAPVADPDPGTAALLLELEGAGITRAFEAELTAPVLEHVDERLAELD